MRILVTNDDGVDATGLAVLARELTKVGDVIVVAPDGEYSGSGAAVGPLWEQKPVVQRGVLDGVDESWSVSGPPGLCVLYARLGAFGEPPGLVVSGVNPGNNTGRAVYHSGTVGATLTARTGGISGVAVSQDVAGLAVDGQGIPTSEQHWSSAAEVAAVIAEALIDEPPEHAVALNVNVPNRPTEQIPGWRTAGLAAASWYTISNARLVERPGHDGGYTVETEWGLAGTPITGTDVAAVAEGFVAVTLLGSLGRAGDEPDAVAAALDQHFPG